MDSYNQFDEQFRQVIHDRIAGCDHPSEDEDEWQCSMIREGVVDLLRDWGVDVRP